MTQSSLTYGLLRMRINQITLHQRAVNGDQQAHDELIFNQIVIRVSHSAFRRDQRQKARAGQMARQLPGLVHEWRLALEKAYSDAAIIARRNTYFAMSCMTPEHWDLIESSGEVPQLIEDWEYITQHYPVDSVLPA